MGVNCEIVYDNNTNGIYNAGETLSGEVKLTLGKAKKIKGIILKVEGYAKCSWTDLDLIESDDMPIPIPYSGQQKYLNHMSQLLGSNSGSEIDLQPGVHTYKFSCVLPNNLPMSLEVPHGYIRYRTKVILRRSWDDDISFKNEFTVMKQLDLNKEVPSLNVPLTMETVKKFTFGGPNSFQMSATILISGFVVGQTVNISAEINNQTDVKIDYLKILLKRIIRSQYTFPWKMDKKEVTTEYEKRCIGLQKKEIKKFVENFRIPAVPPTNVNFCTVIQVSYELHLKAKVSDFHTSPVLKIPITIGTIPLQEN